MICQTEKTEEKVNEVHRTEEKKKTEKDAQQHEHGDVSQLDLLFLLIFV